jgi:hypothetical protein
MPAQRRSGEGTNRSGNHGRRDRVVIRALLPAAHRLLGVLAAHALFGLKLIERFARCWHHCHSGRQRGGGTTGS